MTKKELIDTISSRTNLPRKTVAEVLSSLTEIVQEQVGKQDHEVTIPGLVKISAEHREARIGRNPRSGEQIRIPAKRVPKIKPLQALKDAVA